MKHDPKEVFGALPHVKTIWVTKDGEFHLHSANGGEEITREQVEAEIQAALDADEDEDLTGSNEDETNVEDLEVEDIQIEDIQVEQQVIEEVIKESQPSPKKVKKP